MALPTVLLCIVLLILLISWCRLNAFLAFLLVSILAGILLGIPLNKVVASVEHGMGDTLGSLTIIIALGAMLGKLVASSGAARTIATSLMDLFGMKYIQWALVATGFIIGIPLFYSVGFVLMIPLIFSVVYQYKLPAVYIGLPMLAALSVTHGFLPPHPSPTALVVQFKANMGFTLLYGLAVAVPAIIVAGPLFSMTLKKIPSIPSVLFGENDPEGAAGIASGNTVSGDIRSPGGLPGRFNSFGSSLLPVFMLVITGAAQYFCSGHHPLLQSLAGFAGDPAIVMLVSLLVAAYSLGISMGKSVSQVMGIYAEAIKDIAMVLLIIAGAGALKQVLSDSGVSVVIASKLQSLKMPPLILGWLIASILRLCVGSATVAGLTAAGIVLPLMNVSHVNPNLMVLAIGAGSLMFSHVNDAGFWMFKEYFNLTIKDTFKSWSVMETLVGLVGLMGVLLLNRLV
ncbi:MAG: gluconate:H+ symporter [Puia sp.]|nr:gluconate:H+ symporter [Puia sp.]